MKARLTTDGREFFPNVLRTQEFIDKGVLFGDDPLLDGAFERLSWAVVDPRKHVMFIFETDQGDDFVEEARDLGASVVTNGSFNTYAGGGKATSVVKAGVATVWTMLEALPRAIRRAPDLDPGLPLGLRIAQALNNDRRVKAEVERHQQRYFSSPYPNGYIFGTSEGISYTEVSTPEQHFFGRRGGRQFEHYSIGLGDPPLTGEVIGGLFRAVDAYRPADPFPDQLVGFGLWGLAPLINDPALTDAGVAGAIAELREAEQDETLPEPTGLLVTAFWWGSIAKVIDLFVAARVKDAVRIDGNSSILLGRGAEILVNEGMITPKRYYNRWGYQFQRG